MAALKSREEFTDYCLRRLGAPVIEINVDPDQVDDRIDDAIQYWQDCHNEGTQKFYWIHKITQNDINNMWLDALQATDSDGDGVEIIGVTRIFPLTDSQASVSMFDLRYQLRLNELYDFTSASYINYTMTMQHLRSLEQMFSGEQQIRWNRAMQRLYIDWGWNDYSVIVGQVVIMECYGNVDPTKYPNVWNDRFLKGYSTALIKRQWGTNMKKHKNIQLPGGVTLSGQEIFDEATVEIDQLHHEMETNFGGILEFQMN